MSVSSSSKPLTPSFGPRLLLLLAAAVGLGVLVTVLVQRVWLADPVPDLAAADNSLVISEANPVDTDVEQAQFVPLPHRSAVTSVAPPILPLGGLPGEAGETRSAQELRLELDQRFRAEKRDPAWANAQEEAVLNAIAGTEHDGFDVPLPQSVEARCRSSMCRIQMTYRDEDDAAEMQAKLMLGVPPALSSALTLFIPNDNKGTDMVVFAGSPGTF